MCACSFFQFSAIFTAIFILLSSLLKTAKFKKKSKKKKHCNKRKFKKNMSSHFYLSSVQISVFFSSTSIRLAGSFHSTYIWQYENVGRIAD